MTQAPEDRITGVKTPASAVLWQWRIETKTGVSGSQRSGTAPWDCSVFSTDDTNLLTGALCDNPNQSLNILPNFSPLCPTVTQMSVESNLSGNKLLLVAYNKVVIRQVDIAIQTIKNHNLKNEICHLLDRELGLRTHGFWICLLGPAICTVQFQKCTFYCNVLIKLRDKSSNFCFQC